ncbi:MAG: hypothetical protein V1652_01885 [bacterium]
MTKVTLAICPICTIAVGAGLGLSRWLGIDDAITGLWLGGLTISLIEWTIRWADTKSIKFYLRNTGIFVSYYGFLWLSVYLMGEKSPLTISFLKGFDKVFLGIIVGSIIFHCGVRWYDYMKEKNGGRAYFPFQKVVMPVAPLIIMSIIFYLMIM